MKKNFGYLEFLKPLLWRGWGGFVFFLFLFANYGFAQQNKNFFYTYANGEKYVVVPEVVLQIAPSLGAATSDTLSFGTQVNVLLQVPYSEVIDGYEIPWLKISYKKGEFTKVSFVLATKLSLVSVKVEDEVYALGWGERKEMKTEYTDTTTVNFIENFFWVNNKNISKKYLFELTQNLIPDSIQPKYENNIGVKKTKGNLAVTFNQVSKNTSLQVNYFICADSKELVSIPFLCNSSTNNGSGKIQTLLFPSKNKIKKNQFAVYEKIDIPKEIHRETTTYYKFDNCSYNLISPKK